MDLIRNDELLSRAQAARLLGVAPQTISTLAARNNLPTKRIKGHRRYWFRKSDIMGLIMPPVEVEG